MTRAMLLCAGRGERLASLSSLCPKPLLPVCNIPILRYGITHLVSQGVTDIVINLHHRGDQIKEELGDGSDMGACILYSEEDTMLGTGGGLKHALEMLDPDGKDEPFISLNGKLIFDFNVAEVLKAYQDSDSLGMMVVKYAGNALKWGAVDVAKEGKQFIVRNILEEGEYMFSGVHVTRPSVVAKFPDGEACMVRQGYLPWIQAGQKVSAFVHEKGYFAEHSTPKRYLQSNIDLLQAQVLPFPPKGFAGDVPTMGIHESVVIKGPVSIAEGVEIGAHCQIGPNVVIGKGAKIAVRSALSECVVWRDTQVSGIHQRCIITPQGVLQADGGDEVDS